MKGGIIERYNKKVRNILNAYGNRKIVDAYVIRTPLPNILKKILYLVSQGKSLELHDDYFHLAIVFILEDGTKILMEKNETINAEVNKTGITNESTSMRVPRIKNKNTTINIMLDNTIKQMGTTKYYQYRAFSENCQNWLMNILSSNRLLTNPLKNFIYQDMKQLIENVPTWAQKIANVITDTASYLRQLKGGIKCI